MENSVKKTTKEIIAMFLNYKKEISFSGVTFGSITYIVDEHGSKMVEGKRMLRKQVTTNIMLGASYEDKVNRIIAKENEDKKKNEQNGVFSSQEMKGKRYIQEGNRFVAETIKTGELLLCYIIDTHIAPKTIYLLNGKQIPTEVARTEQYFTPSGLNPKRAEMGGIEDENKFHFNTLYFKNIVKIVMNKTTYIIED